MTDEKPSQNSLTFGDNRLLDTTRFESYLNKNGVEKTAGYLEALSDFMDEIDKILFHRWPTGSYGPNTLAAIRRELLNSIRAKDAFVSSEVVQQFYEENNQRKPKVLPR